MAVVSGSLSGGTEAPRRRSLAALTSRRGAAVRSRTPWMVIVSALLLCQAAILFGAVNNVFTLYGDARAHLDIARRLSDGITPGFAQLGSVWLPLPHLLMAPLAAIDALWHSAAAGVIIGGLSFVYSAVRIYTLAEEWLHSRVAAWVAFLVYAVNLDLLYIQTTALSEPVLLAFFVGGVFHLTRWTRTAASRDLVLAALMVMGATLTRYDGWALYLVGLAVVGVWSHRYQRAGHSTQANLIVYACVAGYGIALWFLYNLIIFHDPLQFMHSSFSSASQQQSLGRAGLLPTKGNLIESALTYMWSVLDVAGIATVVVGLLGVVVGMVTRGNRARLLAVMIVLSAPLLLNVVSLWLGESTIRIPQRAPYGFWNVRYGLMALPLLALGAGLLVQRLRVLAPVVVLALLAGTAWAATGTPATLADGRYGVSSAAAGRPELAAALLARDYHGGRILADDASASGVMYASGLNLSEFVTVGFHPYFENALAAPASNVRWVVVYDGDLVAQAMAQHPDRYAAFHLTTRDGRVRLFTLGAAPPLSKASSIPVRDSGSIVWRN